MSRPFGLHMVYFGVPCLSSALRGPMTANTPNNQSDQPVNPPERRKLRRIPALSALLFSSATGPMREGSLKNRSASGLCIETSQPEHPGTEIDIEIKPIPGVLGSETIFLSGRVANIRPSEGTRFLMGARLTDTLMGSGRNERRTATAGRSTGSLDGRGRDARGSGGRTRRASEPIGARTAKTTGEASPRQKSRDIKRYVLLFLLVFLLSLLGSDLTVNALVKNKPGPSFIVNAVLPNLTPDKPANPSEHRDVASDGNLVNMEIAEPERVELKAMPQGEARASALATLSQSKSQGEAPPGTRERSEPSNPVQKFARTLALARRADAIGDTGLALHLLRTGLASADSIPAPWVKKGERLEDALSKGDHSALASNMSQLVNFDPMGGAIDPQKVDPVRVRVDVNDYVLDVIVGDRVVRSFPVGLGLDGATPLGTFTIANKLTDPDWYNRGIVVPAGSPENQIGHRWMGLGDSHGATSYGIHPAQDTRAIGQPQSRGCVRMYPEDAETLFRIVPLGTPVEIR